MRQTTIQPVTLLVAAIVVAVVHPILTIQKLTAALVQRMQSHCLTPSSQIPQLKCLQVRWL
jgi:hypothetical protein